MKASELMIGDTLRYKQDFPFASLQGKIAKVCGVDGRVDVRTIDDDKFHESEHPNWLEPIPLTPEILEKNGFRHGSYVGGYYSPDCPFRVFVKTEGGCEFTTLFDDEIHFSCIFVHQLQHALRLYGIEKEIVL